MRTHTKTIWDRLVERQAYMPGQLTVISGKVDTGSAPFAEALQEGRLSRLKSSPNYIGKYVFAGRASSGRPRFKHIDTGEFLV